MKLGKKLLSLLLAALTLMTCFACLTFSASAKNTPDVTKVTVTFDPNGGSISMLEKTKTVTVGNTYGTLPTPSRTGYDFLGWYDGYSKISDTTTVNKDTDHTLTAKWQGKLVAVTFDPKGGSVTPNNKDVRYGDTYGTLPIPTKGNDTFLGWYTLTGDLVNSSTTVSTLISHTLYAHWQDSSVLTPTIVIKNYAETKKIDYRTTITFTAQTKNAAGMEVHWFVNGEDYATGEQCTIKEAKKDFTIQAKLMLRGTAIASSMIENVKVNSGLFARLIAFFRSIFGSLPKVAQGYFA